MFEALINAFRAPDIRRRIIFVLGMAPLVSSPPEQPGEGCLVTDQTGFSDPGSFSLDGAQFVFDDTRFDETTLETVVGQGVFVMDVDATADDCGASSALLIAPGGAQPDWGAQAP